MSSYTTVTIYDFPTTLLLLSTLPYIKPITFQLQCTTLLFTAYPTIAIHFTIHFLLSLSNYNNIAIHLFTTSLLLSRYTISMATGQWPLQLYYCSLHYSLHHSLITFTFTIYFTIHFTIHLHYFTYSVHL